MDPHHSSPPSYEAMRENSATQVYCGRNTNYESASYEEDAHSRCVWFGSYCFATLGSTIRGPKEAAMPGQCNTLVSRPVELFSKNIATRGNFH